MHPNFILLLLGLLLFSTRGILRLKDTLKDVQAQNCKNKTNDHAVAFLSLVCFRWPLSANASFALMLQTSKQTPVI